MTELQILKKFTRHPCFLKLFDHSPVTKSPDGETFTLLLLLEYYPKGTLKDLVEKADKEGKSIPEATLIDIFMKYLFVYKYLQITISQF